MNTIIAIETSSFVCSVSFICNGIILSTKQTSEHNAHSRLLTGMILEILKEKDISKENIGAIAISKGPGSYTGLRIGVSVAKGLCYGWSKPLIAVDTVKAQAAFYLKNNEVSEQELLCPLFDARRMEVYTALYDNRLVEVLPVQAMIIDQTSFVSFLQNKKVLFFGTGAEKCKEAINHPNSNFVDNILPTSLGVAYLANDMFLKNEFVDVAYFEPFYMKEFIAGKPTKKVI